MTSFNTIQEDEDNGLIKGEMSDDGGVVAISKEDWTETNEDELTGNWEEITQTIIDNVLDAGSLRDGVETDSSVSVKRDEVADILSDSSIINHEDEDEERLRAELLIEYLCLEGVYHEQGDEIVVLDDFDETSDMFSKLNWSAFFSYAVDEINTVVKSAENQKRTIVEMFERSGEGLGTDTVPDLPSKEELMEDLRRITGKRTEPVGYENGFPKPPKGVDPEDEWEYKQIVKDLETIENFTVQPPEEGNRKAIEEELQAQIRRMERVASKMQEIEGDVRNAAIKDIAEIPKLQEQIEQYREFTVGIFSGETSKDREDEDEQVEHASSVIRKAAEETGIDPGGVDTEVEEPQDPIQDVQESVEDSPEEPGEAEEVGEMFGSESQN
jgi:hypothetical protein